MGSQKIYAMYLRTIVKLRFRNTSFLTTKHRVVNYCILDWQAALSTTSRCDHYDTFKCLLTVETYLTMDIQLKYKIAMSKFRLSNHRLNIELGRYNNVLKENRICNVCQQLNNTNVI